MATSWIESVRNTHQLTIFPGASIMAGPWRAPFLAMIQEFNKQSAALNLGVTVAQSATPPDPNGQGGANVQMEAVSGVFSFTVSGATLSGTLGGKSASGLTKHLISVFSQRTPAGPTEVRRIINALIAVPATPQTLSGDKSRLVGDGVLLCVAFHELLHACGLANSDHGGNDIFFGSPQLRTATRAKDDKITAGKSDTDPQMPPIVVGPQTAARVRALWT